MKESISIMGLIEIASGNSVWRGMDYYENKKVASWQEIGEGKYSGKVSGSGGKMYDVEIDKMHPRKSKCNCPFADGRRVVCKHMIALLFTAEPKQAEDFMKKVEAYEAEEERREQEYYETMKEYVYSLSKEDLRRLYLDALFELEEYRRNRW